MFLDPRNLDYERLVRSCSLESCVFSCSVKSSLWETSSVSAVLPRAMDRYVLVPLLVLCLLMASSTALEMNAEAGVFGARCVPSPSLNVPVSPCYGSDCLPTYVCHSFPCLFIPISAPLKEPAAVSICPFWVFLLSPLSPSFLRYFSPVFPSSDGIRTNLTICFSIYRPILSNKDAGAAKVLRPSRGEMNPLYSPISSYSSRADLAGTINLTPTTAWTNTTFGEQLCPLMDTTTTRVTVNLVTLIALARTRLLLQLWLCHVPHDG